MHTLPLPAVPTDAYPNSKPEASRKFESPSPPPALEPPAGHAFSAERAPIPRGRLTPQQLQFLLRVAPPALESQRAYGIPACVTIAQAILESATPKLGWGSSVLFRLANNPFGIKFRGSQEKLSGVRGPLSVAASDGQRTTDNGRIADDYGHFDAATWEIENGQRKEVIAQFARFRNLEEAFKAHALLLSTNPRYAPAMQTLRDTGHGIRDTGDRTRDPGPGTRDPGTEVGEKTTESGFRIPQAAVPSWKIFAERLGPKTSQLDTEHCGYSTNPSYSAILRKLIEQYRLDDPRALTWYATGKDPGPGYGTRDS